MPIKTRKTMPCSIGRSTAGLGFFGRNVCQAVINGVIVYRDSINVTATFAKKLADPLAELLD